MMKRAAIFMLISVLLLWSGAGQAAPGISQTAIYVDGRQILAPAQTENGSLMLPLRAICEAAGYKVGWAIDEREVSVIKPAGKISFKIGSNKLYANDHETYMMRVPVVIKGRTYVSEDLLTDYLGLTVRLDKAKGWLVIQSFAENPIVINNVKKENKEKNYSVTLQYPQLQGLSDMQVQKSLNARFAEMAVNAEKTGLQNREELTPADHARNAQIETYFDYLVKYNRHGFLSIVFSEYQYSGGAHGLTVQTSVTVNLKTGDEYELKDFFLEGADYTGLINREIKRQMDDQGLTPNLLKPFVSIKSDQYFYLNGERLVIYFQQYEYAAYALGILEYQIDISSLNKIIKPEVHF